MAYKPKPHDYTFKLRSDTLIEVTKTDDEGQALQVYTVKGNLRGACFCDCPASWSQKRHGKPDKHVGWVHRYMALMDKMKDTIPQGAFVYYNSGTDKFVLNSALADGVQTLEG